MDVLERVENMKNRARVLAGNRHGPAMVRLLEDIVEILGFEVVSLRREVRGLESKLDSYMSTVRSDISHVRQRLNRAGEE